MSRKGLHLVWNKAKPIRSDTSISGEARLLELADIALHNPPRQEIRPPGSRANEGHRNLMKELQQAADRVRRLKRVA